MRFFLSVLYALFLLGTVASAWPWRPYGLVLGEGDAVEKRAAATTDASTGASASITTPTQTSTGTDTNTGTQTTGTTTGKSADTKTSTSTSISINPAGYPGGISMLTPAATSTTYYKIGQYVTFVWNYTSLLVTPSAVDVVASCSLNSATYTLASNMSVKPTGSVVWDTGHQASATIPLLTATYTLFVYPADGSLNAPAKAGYLSSDFGYYFGMYIPQPYTPLNEFRCATCNGAMSESQRQALKFAVGMAAITVVTFTWFAGGVGVFST